MATSEAGDGGLLGVGRAGAGARRYPAGACGALAADHPGAAAVAAVVTWTLQDQLDWEILREAPAEIAAEVAARRPDLAVQYEAPYDVLATVGVPPVFPWWRHAWRARMIAYADVRRGDILKVVGAGAPGYAQLGDLVRVTAVQANGVTVENKHGQTAEFVFNCGAARLEPTEWRDDFPVEASV